MAAEISAQTTADGVVIHEATTVVTESVSDALGRTHKSVNAAITEQIDRASVTSDDPPTEPTEGGADKSLPEDEDREEDDGDEDPAQSNLEEGKPESKESAQPEEAAQQKDQSNESCQQQEASEASAPQNAEAAAPKAEKSDAQEQSSADRKRQLEGTENCGSAPANTEQEDSPPSPPEAKKAKTAQPVE